MSATETKTVTVEPVVIKRTISGFDEHLNPIEKTIDVPFTEAVTYEEAASRLNSDVTLMLKGLNLVLKSEAVKAAKAAAGISGAINREVLMNFIKPWREFPDFAKLVTAEDKRKATAEEWNAQTEAILTQIRMQPFILNQIKALSAKSAGDDE